MSDSTSTRRGIVLGIGAYGLWGLLPLYFAALGDVPPPEVLAHRALWSFVLLAAIVTLAGRWRELAQSLRRGKAILAVVVSSLLIGVNWLTFIYAVEVGRLVEASAAYFITPLLNVLLGVLLLGERLRRLQWVAVVLAGIGVALIGWTQAEWPWMIAVLSVTFALYGLLRKVMHLDSLLGLTVETLLMAPFALVYLWAFGSTLSDVSIAPGRFALLMAAGPATTVPLLCFAGAARRLPLATLGVLQYLAPTLQFLVAVVALGEPCAVGRLASFAWIWIGVAIYAIDSLSAVRPDVTAVAGATEAAEFD